MAKGHDRVAQETAERQERQKQFDANRTPQLWLKEGEWANVRFLEQGPDVNNFIRHPYTRITKKGKRVTEQFTCLNDKNDGTPCPGCAGGLESKIRGVYNVIQRQRPVFRKGQDGYAMKDGQGNFIVDGHQDEVVFWNIGSLTAEAIRQIDNDYHGMMSRDFKISRSSGSSFQPYVFSPADVDAGPQPMSEVDQQLAQKKHNLDEVMAPPTYQEAARIVATQQNMPSQAQQQPQQGQGQPVQQSPVAENPFMGTEQPS